MPVRFTNYQSYQFINTTPHHTTPHIHTTHTHHTYTPLRVFPAWSFPYDQYSPHPPIQTQQKGDIHCGLCMSPNCRWAYQPILAYHRIYERRSMKLGQIPNVSIKFPQSPEPHHSQWVHSSSFHMPVTVPYTHPQATPRLSSIPHNTQLSDNTHLL